MRTRSYHMMTCVAYDTGRCCICQWHTVIQGHIYNHSGFPWSAIGFQGMRWYLFRDCWIGILHMGCLS